MKYRKPQYAFTSCINRDSIDIVTGAKQLVDFLRSLPDEFEIVPEGHVCVKWPDKLSAQALRRLACLSPTDNPERTSALIDLAAIAPERKKRKWNLWIVGDDPRPYAQPENWSPRDHPHQWRKVGECEIEE